MSAELQESFSYGAFHVTPQRQAMLKELLNGLGILKPQQWELYDQALTHSSFTYEHGHSSLHNYERLEFLGDAVLKLVVSEYLFERFPYYREGELTKIRAVVVSDAILADLARQVALGRYMIFGQSEARSGGARKNSNLACGFEALLGALYLDGQLPFIRQFLVALMEDCITEVDLNKTKDNFKAALQEYTQGEGIGLPDYTTISESGPPHNKTFHVEVRVNGEVLGFGQGKTKKEAQQQAARLALLALNQLPTDPEEEGGDSPSASSSAPAPA